MKTMKTKTRALKATPKAAKRSATTALQRATTTATETARNALSTLSKQVGGMPARMSDARRTLGGLGAKGVKQLKKHPVGAVVGAFATGVALTKLASRG